MLLCCLGSACTQAQHYYKHRCFYNLVEKLIILLMPISGHAASQETSAPVRQPQPLRRAPARPGVGIQSSPGGTGPKAEPGTGSLLTQPSSCPRPGADISRLSDAPGFREPSQTPRRAPLGAPAWSEMDQSKPLKVRLTFSVILVGISLLFAAVVTDHWAVLSPSVEENTTTCEAAHFGLWRLCTKRIFMQEQGPKEKSCGPISLPGGT